MKVLLLFIYLNGYLCHASDEALPHLKIKFVQPETEQKIIEIATKGKNAVEGDYFNKWVIRKNRFDELVKEFSKLPPSTDKIKNCPRSYLQIEYLTKYFKRTEFVCFNRSTPIRTRYVAFANKVI